MFILKVTKVLRPTEEQFEVTTSLPQTASKEELFETIQKMAYGPQKRMEFINALELEGQKKDNAVRHGITDKNAANAAGLKGAAKKVN